MHVEVVAGLRHQQADLGSLFGVEVGQRLHAVVVRQGHCGGTRLEDAVAQNLEVLERQAVGALQVLGQISRTVERFLDVVDVGRDVETAEQSLREFVAVDVIGELLRQGVHDEGENAAVGKGGVTHGGKGFTELGDVGDHALGREVIGALGNLDIAALDAAAGRVALLVAHEVVAARRDVRRVLVDPCRLESLVVAPGAVARGRDEQDRLVRADLVQVVGQCRLGSEDGVREALAEVSFVVRMSFDEFLDGLEDVFLRLAFAQKGAACKCGCHQGMDVAVDEARKHHLALKVGDLGALGALQCFVR